MLIDKMVMKNCKRRKTSLSMIWLDYKKAYDMIPHSWIVKCLEIYNIASNITAVIKNGMKQWNTELTSGNEKLCKIDIKRGIFQGDSLSPLLFVMCMMPLSTLLEKGKAGYDLGNNRGKINHLLYMDDLKLYARNKKETDALISTTQIYSKDICMELGISKCAHITLQRGKVVSEEGLEILDEQCIDEVDGETGYEYLGILEANDIKHEQMKDKITKSVLNTKLCNLQRYQDRALELIESSINNAYNKNILNVNQLLIFDRAVMTFKIVNQLCPEGLQNKFIERSALSKYNTRNMKDLHVQKLKLEHTKKSFLYTGPKAWNSIPQHIRDTESVVRFKKDLKSHLLS